METVAGLILIAIAFVFLGARQKRNIYSIFYLSISLILIQIASGIITTYSSYSLTNVFLIALWGFRIFIFVLFILVLYEVFRSGLFTTWRGIWGNIKEVQE